MSYLIKQTAKTKMLLFSYFVKKYFEKIVSAKSFFLELTYTLRDKCPNKELFLVRIFPRSEISVLSPNTGKYGPEKTPCLDTFHKGIHTLILIFTMILKSFKIISIAASDFLLLLTGQW